MCVKKELEDCYRTTNHLWLVRAVWPHLFRNREEPLEKSDETVTERVPSYDLWKFFGISEIQKVTERNSIINCYKKYILNLHGLLTACQASSGELLLWELSLQLKMGFLLCSSRISNITFHLPSLEFNCFACHFRQTCDFGATTGVEQSDWDTLSHA